MKKILDFRYVVILGLIGLSVFLLVNDSGTTKIVKETIQGAEIHDTILQEVPIYLDGTIEYRDTTIFVPTIVNVDTLSILKIYFNKVLKKDTLILPNNQGFIYLSDSISKNNITYRVFTSKIKQKIVRELAPEPIKPTTQIFFGVNSAFSKEDWVNSYGTGILLKTKDDKIFQVGVGVANRTTDGISGSFSPYVMGGIYWKIKLKKKE